MTWPASRPVAAAAQPPSFVGSASARIRELERAVHQARYALQLRQCRHEGTRSDECPACLADELLEKVQR